MLAASAQQPLPELTTAQVRQQSQEAPGYSIGPFNLIIRWGAGSPVAIRYDNRQRCELAAVEVDTQGDAFADEIDARGNPIPPNEKVRGANAPWAFCIPG
jgi:hypothetical protein